MSKAKSFTFDDSDYLSVSPAPKPVEKSEMQSLGRRRMFNVAKISLDRIVSKPQVRETFDEEQLQELADSLAKKGQQQPIRLRWDENEGDDGRYIILMGERRFRAAKMAGLEELEAVIHEGDLTDAEITELQLIENIVRENLNAIEEARAFKKIMEDRKAAGLPSSAKDLAKEIGLSDTKVQRSVRLLTLPEDIQADVASGTVPPSVIREMFRLNSEEERRELLAAYKSGESFGEITQTVKAKKAGKGNASGPKTKKTFTTGAIKLQATAKKKVTQAEIAEALELWLTEIRTDGRSSRAA